MSGALRARRYLRPEPRRPAETGSVRREDLSNPTAMAANPGDSLHDCSTRLSNCGYRASFPQPSTPRSRQGLARNGVSVSSVALRLPTAVADGIMAEGGLTDPPVHIGRHARPVRAASPTGASCHQTHGDSGPMRRRSTRRARCSCSREWSGRGALSASALSAPVDVYAIQMDSKSHGLVVIPTTS